MERTFDWKIILHDDDGLRSQEFKQQIDWRLHTTRGSADCSIKIAPALHMFNIPQPWGFSPAIQNEWQVVIQTRILVHPNKVLHVRHGHNTWQSPGARGFTFFTERTEHCKRRKRKTKITVYLQVWNQSNSGQAFKLVCNRLWDSTSIRSKPVQSTLFGHPRRQGHTWSS